MYRAEGNMNSVQESQTSSSFGTVAVEAEVPEQVLGNCWLGILQKLALGKDDYA
jgi:hypothetical protein